MLRELAEMEIEHGLSELLSEAALFFSALTSGTCAVFEVNSISHDLELILAGSNKPTKDNHNVQTRITIPRDSRISKTLRGNEWISLTELSGDSTALQSFGGSWCERGDLIPLRKGGTLYGLILLETTKELQSQKDLLITMASQLALLCELATLCSKLRLTNEIESLLDAPLMIIDTNNGTFERTNRKATSILNLDQVAGTKNAFDLIPGLQSLIELLRKSQNPSSISRRSDRMSLKGVNYSVFGALIENELKEKAIFVLFELAPSGQRDSAESQQGMPDETYRVKVLSKQLTVERQSRQMISKIYSFLDSDSVLQTLVDGLGMALGCQRCIVAKMPDQASPVVTYEYADPDISPLGLGRMTQFPKNIYNLLLTGVTCLPDVSSLRGTVGILPQDINNLHQNGISSLMGAPIIYRDSTFGIVACTESERIRDWLAHEVDLVRLIAHHAAVSLTHCKQHEELKDQLFNAEVMRNITEQLTRTLQIASNLGKQTVEKKKERVQPANLSTRELEVLKLIASGLANKEIANQLFLTESTVELHASRIRKKLSLKSRTALVKYACDNGLA